MEISLVLTAAKDVTPNDPRKDEIDSGAKGIGEVILNGVVARRVIFCVDQGNIMVPPADQVAKLTFEQAGIKLSDENSAAGVMNLIENILMGQYALLTKTGEGSNIRVDSNRY